LAAIDLSQRKRGPSWEKNGAILTFDTGDSQTGGGQLPQMGKMGRQLAVYQSRRKKRQTATGSPAARLGDKKRSAAPEAPRNYPELCLPVPSEMCMKTNYWFNKARAVQIRPLT